MQKSSQNPLNSQTTAQQQNISINISYNLNTHKIPASIIGAKKQGSKSKKVHVPGLQSIGNQFFSHMAFNPIHQGKKSIKKQNLSKKSNEPILATKQGKTSNEKKGNLKKKKVKQVIATEPNFPPSDAVVQYYNPLANNSKNFLKRTVQSPDIFKVQYSRKLKTQASNYQPNESTFKKLKRSSGHPKQTQSGLFTKSTKINNFFKDTGFNFVGHKQQPSLNAVHKKPSVGSSKTPKNRKSNQQIKQKQKRVNTQQNQNFIKTSVPQGRHNKSCMLYSTKKQGVITQPHLVESAEHIFSTYVNTNSNKLPRKRAQSAYSFSRNGKQLVSKLLNMSMISSELGSSQLISSERMKSGRNEITRKKLGLKVDEFDQYNHYQRHVQPSQTEAINYQKQQSQQAQPGNALRQYLNSIDLRIIKRIEDDTANIATLKQPKEQKQQKPRNKQPQKEKLLFKITNKNNNSKKQQETVNQTDNDVVSFYNKLFSNALQNKRIQQEQQKYLDSPKLSSERKSLSIDFNQTAKLKKQKFTIDGFEDQEEEQQQNDASGNGTVQVYEFVKPEKPEGSRKLNFQHYKDLLNRQADKEKKQPEEVNQQLLNCDKEFEFVAYKGQKQEDEDIRIRRSIQKLEAANFYQKAINDLIQNSFKPSQSVSSAGSSLTQFKEQHVERWNNINKQMSLKISSGMEKQSMQARVGQKWAEEAQHGDEEQVQDEDSQLISQERTEIKQQIMLLNREPVKSPKHSNRQKFVAAEPEYNQVCWQYNAEQLTKEIQNYSKNQEVSKKPASNIYNSPNNISQDGNGSGEEEYDSKKYSQVTVYKDTEQQQGAHEKKQKNLLKQSGSNSLIDSLEQNEEQLSFEEKQIGIDNRWIEANYQEGGDRTDGRIKKFTRSSECRTEKSSGKDYLDCELSCFGVRNILSRRQKPNEPVISIDIPKQIKPADPFVHQESLQEAEKPEVIQGHFKLTINGRQTKQKITLQVSQPGDKKDTFSQIRRKRLTHIVEDIILEMIRQFAKDISYILKKSSYDKRTQQEIDENTSPFRSYKQQHDQNQLSPFQKEPQPFEGMHYQQSRKQQLKKSQFVGKCFGIDTSFISVQRYLVEFKDYLLKDENMKKLIIKNINKDIGPNSLEILSYLRPEYQTQDQAEANELNPDNQKQEQQDNCEDEDGLFVVPSQAFSEFENYLQQQIDEKNKSLEPQQQTILTQKQKRNTNFWHRGIYESWNQFLDYERPYGINGKPYEWVKERKKFRQVQLDQVEKKLQKGIDKLLEAISLPSGIIYDKYDLPPMYADLCEQQKIFLNEERLSRMLAIQLFESQETWINYNDEMAELLVELGRIIEDRIFFEMTTEVKKVFRRRNLLASPIQDPNSEQADNSQQTNTNPKQLLTNMQQSGDEKWLIEEADDLDQ